jgi:plasmid maintenance system antidote protein VapI
MAFAKGQKFQLLALFFRPIVKLTQVLQIGILINMNYEVLAHNIKKTIKETKGLTQRILAKEVGLTENELSRLLGATNQIKTLRDIMTHLDEKYPKKVQMLLNLDLEPVEETEENLNGPDQSELLSIFEYQLFADLIKDSKIPKEQKSILKKKIKNLSLERFYK